MTTGAGSRPPVGYTLRVKGRLDPRWGDWFDGFTFTGETDGTTTLTGAVADQARLHGLLTKIRDLGITLISLEATGPTSSGGAAPDPADPPTEPVLCGWRAVMTAIAALGGNGWVRMTWTG